MAKNNRRYDLSNRLTHFFRKLDLSDGSAPATPECWGLNNFTEGTVFSPLFLLRCAIRHGRLWATWSFRSGIRTVYGRSPATCFTDMPTSAFLETSAARLKKRQKISTYALTFPKPQMFAVGARPVLYGLSVPARGIPNGKGGVARIIPEAILPNAEQYRYVTYAPTGGRWEIDWTHEREWRWPMKNEAELKRFETRLAKWGCVSEVNDIPGLNLYSGQLRGIGVIVNTREEAKKVFHDILALVDRKVINSDTFEYVLVSDDIPSPEAIRGPEEEADTIAAASINLSSYLSPSPQRDHAFINRVRKLAEDIDQRANPPLEGEPGCCWLWLLDNVHDVTRAFANSGTLIVNHEGKYLLPIEEFSLNRGLAQREAMVEELARHIRSEFGVEAGYFSVLNSDDPDDHPYYNDDFLDNRLFYNWWSDGI